MDHPSNITAEHPTKSRSKNPFYICTECNNRSSAFPIGTFNNKFCGECGKNLIDNNEQKLCAGCDMVLDRDSKDNYCRNCGMPTCVPKLPSLKMVHKGAITPKRNYSDYVLLGGFICFICVILFIYWNHK